ncbi:MarR family winged helix-turn-helix transcriptional regulator [Glycomyces arizonensis]|uniref:MarR family winged helix-turn-helix transcriptional regulator n=1 Tax=Glycomyces arizonensis TaxID=256035 RepID=UPI00047BC19A|nr:MarR family transcriptional regulator [Glycomyces arizonensis]
MEHDAVAAFVEQWKRERPDLDPSPLLVIGRLFRVTEALDKHLRPPFAAAELGNGDFDVLAALRRSGEPYALAPGELSRTILVTTGAITKRVDRLEARGLVTRAVTEADARGRVVTLTESGRALTDELMAAHLENQRGLLGALSEKEQERLAELLGRLARSLDD